MNTPDPPVEDLSVEQLEALLRAKRGREHVRLIERITAEESARLRAQPSPRANPLEAGVQLVEQGARGLWRRLPAERVEFNAVEMTPLARGRSRKARLRAILDWLLGRE